MTRLPKPGGDNGTWGSILNDYLSKVHAPDGTLKTDSVTSDAIAPHAITSASIAPAAVTTHALAPAAITAAVIAPNSITNAALASNSVDAAIIQNNSITNQLIVDGTIQEVKFDTAVQAKLNQPFPVTSVAEKTGDVVLTKSDIGLSNVDNTSDADKSSAVATLTNKTISGTSNTLTNIAQSSITNLTSDLAAKLSTTTAAATYAPKASPTFTGTVTVPTPTNNTDAATKAYVDSAAASGTPDADATTKGKIKLTGDLGGTAISPSVVRLSGVSISGTPSAGQVLTATGSTTASWSALPTAPVLSVNGYTGNVTLTKSDVGLGNVDNTSDATKNSATATLTNKDLTSVTNTFPTFNQDTTGNAATATKLATARTINGVSFDGTANITIYDSTKEPTISAGTTSQYWRGDKTWQTFDKAAVGLSNVDNTSDATKNSATATLTNKTLTNPVMSQINDSNGNPILSLSPTASATKYVTIYNNSGGASPIIQGVGSTGLDLKVSATAGTFRFLDAGHNPNFVVVGTGSNNAANYVQVTSAATGNAPLLAAAGSDTNVSLNLVPRGTGTIQANGVDVVTTTGTQTLTNKTLTSPKITSYIYDSTGNIHTQIYGAASAVNYLLLANGSAGNGTLIQSLGADTDVNMTYSTKGVGSFWFANSTSNLMTVTGPASAVNYFRVTAATTGNRVSLGATGSDTDVSLSLNTKGSGTVQANGVDVVTTSGTQTLTNKTLTSPKITSGAINDQNGNTLLWINPISSAVNYVGIRNNAAGSAPVLYAGGSDPNVSLNLSSQGSGTVQANGVDVVTTTGTQSLSNKTLASPTINTPKIDTIKDAINNSTMIELYSYGATGNFWRITNSTAASGIPLQLYPAAASADANVGVSITTKGTGTLTLGGAGVTNILAGSSGAVSAQFSSPASAVNYLSINSAATGAKVSVAATGSDTDVSLNLTSKGSGTVQANGNPVGVKVAVPATASSAGVPGQWAADSSYHYDCIATNTWVRSAVATW